MTCWTIKSCGRAPRFSATITHWRVIGLCRSSDIEVQGSEISGLSLFRILLSAFCLLLFYFLHPPIRPGVSAPQPIDLPEMFGRGHLLGLQPIFPFHLLVSAKHTVPDIQRQSKIVMPLVMGMMNVMHRSRHPKTALWILVLKLMAEGRKKNEHVGPDHPADSRRRRNENKRRPHQHPAVFEIIPELQQHALRRPAGMMLAVCFSRSPGHCVHEPVPPIFDKAAEDK